MYFAKNNVAVVENNYLNNRHFLCEMSPDEIVGISEYPGQKRLTSNVGSRYIIET